MANYCPNCGNQVNNGDMYCSNCGNSLSGATNYSNSNIAMSSGAGDILGTLVVVSLVGGLTRELYFHNGRYFLDPYCRRPFRGARIIGHHPMRPPMMGGHCCRMPHTPRMGGLRGGAPRGGMGHPGGGMGGRPGRHR